VPRIRSPEDVRAVLELKAEGCTDRETSRRTGVPVNTIRLWRHRGLSRRAKRALDTGELCARCGAEPHDFAALPPETYGYLLGVYLGDGCVGRSGKSWSLRVALDAPYPGIIEACCDGMEEIRGGHRPRPRPDSRGTACVRVEMTWAQWPCLFPQHGPGRKHRRKIALTDWQRQLVDEAANALLRGLIHTDGWRGVNRVVSKGKRYEYRRYQFSNRSDDIRRIFTDTRDALGIEWRQWTRLHISVAERESVALLDSFVGPKA
jgi:hypothetical protein